MFVYANSLVPNFEKHLLVFMVTFDRITRDLKKQGQIAMCLGRLSSFGELLQ